MASPISPVGLSAAHHIAARPAKPPPGEKEYEKATEVCDRITSSAQPPPTYEELSEAIQVYDRMAKRFAKLAMAAHIARGVTPPVSKTMA
jgi:hypothetical protein